MSEIWVFSYVLALVVCALGSYRLGRGRREVELKDLAALGRDIPTLVLEHERATRKASEYLAKIEEVIVERETWRKLYNDQASGHDNAQALMLQTINTLVHQYQRETGKQPRLDPIIDVVRGEWSGAHSPAVRAGRGEDGKLTEAAPKPA